MIKTIPSCDVCSEDKKLQNHWWTTWVTEDGVFHSARLSEENMYNSGVKHACSAGCNGKFHARWMASGTLEMEKTTSAVVEKTPSVQTEEAIPSIDFETPPESVHVYEGKLK